MRPAIRSAVHGDMTAVRAIYAEAVHTGTAGFEHDPPGLEDLRARRRAVLDAGSPDLVAAAIEGILGFAYTGPFRPRPTYRRTLEDSVHVAAEARGRGVGRALLTGLIEAAAAVGARQMIAVVGDPDHNVAAVALLQRGLRD